MLFSYGNASPLLALLKACGRWGHVFATSANARSLTEKLAMSPFSTVHSGCSALGDRQAGCDQGGPPRWGTTMDYDQAGPPRYGTTSINGEAGPPR